MEEEFDIFKRMLIKSQIVLTTNYDEFIEKSYKEASNYELKSILAKGVLWKIVKITPKYTKFMDA